MFTGGLRPDVVRGGFADIGYVRWPPDVASSRIPSIHGGFLTFLTFLTLHHDSSAPAAIANCAPAALLDLRERERWAT